MANGRGRTTYTNGKGKSRSNGLGRRTSNGKGKRLF